MTTGMEQTSGARRDPGQLSGPHKTLAFPPPKQSTPFTPANSAVSEDEGLPENFFHDEPQSVDWEDPWEGLLEEISPPRRRWPAVIAFTVTGLVVSLIGVAAMHQPRSHVAQPGTLGTKPNASPTVIPPPAATQAAGLAVSVEQSSNSATAQGPSESTVPIAQKPVRAPEPSARRQSARRRAARYIDKSTQESRAEQSGIPVDQIYTNSRGELVDAQGKPLSPKKELPAQVPGFDTEKEQ